MKMTVYIDMLIILNFLVNYIFIKITALLTFTEYKITRIIFASFIGAICSIMIIYDISVCLSLVLKFLSIILCCYIAFGYRGIYRFLKNIIVMFCTYMLFTGFLVVISEYSTQFFIKNFSFYVSINPLLFVIGISVFYILISVIEYLFFRQAPEYLYNIVVETDYESFTATAFYDTGFKLRDVLCNNGVIMCCLDFLMKVGAFNTAAAVSDFYDKGNSVNSSILPLFYSDVSGGGMLAGIKLNRVYVTKNNKNIELKNIVLAVSKNNFSQSEEIIFGKDIYDRLGN